MNVTCPGCNAPYRVDEKRIPPSGVRMKCPKCSLSFTVTAAGVAGEGAAAPLEPARPSVMPRRPERPVRGPAGADLPAVKGAADPFGGIDLPGPAAAPDLPAPKNILDLPEPARGVTDLPRTSHHPPRPAPPAPPPPPVAGKKAPAPSADAGKSRVGFSGSTDYGEIDLGSADAGEFDAFPTRTQDQQAGDHGQASGREERIELADDPRGGRLGFVVDDAAPSPEGEGAAARGKKGAKFEGRRRFERQKRVVRILLLVLLILTALAGAGLTFTPLGPFGAYAIARMLPNAAEQQLVDQVADKVARRIAADTLRDVDGALAEFDLSLKELPDSEDLRLLGSFLHNWHQIRFGEDSRHAAAATKLLGAINVERSESRFVPLAMASKDQLGLKVAKVIQDLERLQGPAPEALALLAEAYLAEGKADKARATARKLAAADKSSPRARYLEARALALAGKTVEARELLREIAARTPSHHDAALLEVMLASEARTADTGELGDRLKAAREAEEGAITARQKARAHALAARLHILDRQFTRAAAELDQAEKLDPKDLVLLVGRGSMALANDDLAAAAGFFVRARAENPGDLLAALGQAETSIRQGGLGEAKGTLVDLLARFPDHPRIHYLLGLAEAALKNHENAEKSLGQAVALDKGYVAAYIALADLQLRQGRDAEALRILDEARGVSPGSPEVNLALADTYAARGDHRKAAAELQAAIAVDARNARAHLRLAQSLRKLGRFEEATRALAEAEALDSNAPGLALEHGLLLEQTGKVRQALVAYEKALAANPEDNGARIRVGAASFLLGRHDRAQELLEQAVAGDPGSADANFYLGEVMRAKGLIAEAVGYLKTAVKLDEANALHHVRLAAALMAARNMSEAARALERAQELDPDMAEVHLRIGESKLRAGAARDALNSLDKALTLDPRLSEAYALAGEALEELADLQAAQAYFRRAVREIPGNGYLFFRLALVELQVSGTRAAATSLAQAVRLGDQEDPRPPWLPEALYRHGSILVSNGQRAQARAVFERYLEIAPDSAIDRPAVRAQLDNL